jgi:hypothetical protein
MLSKALLAAKTYKVSKCNIVNVAPGVYRVLDLTAGLVVIGIALTPDLRD